MKQLTLVPIGGLANRIYAITSAIAFCKDYDVKLRIIWFKDKGMGADFHSLFDLSSEVDKSKVEIIDAKWYHYIYDRPRKRNLWLPFVIQTFCFNYRYYEKNVLQKLNIDKLAEYIKRNKSIYLVAYYNFYNVEKFNFLLLKSAISERVDQIACSFSQKRTIGIHLRRTDNIDSIMNSPLSLFVIGMDKEIASNPDIHFYIASDSMNEKLELQKQYGDRIIMSLKEVQRNNKDGIIDALIELYILSRTCKIYGSAHSSFSTLAASIGGVELEIVSLKK